MTISVAPYSYSAGVVIGDQGGALNHEVHRQDWQLRVVPNTMVNDVRADSDGRSRPPDATQEAIKLPSRFRPIAPRVYGVSVTGWSLRAQRGPMLKDAQGWSLGKNGLHGQTVVGGVPGTDVMLPRRVVHLFQLGDTPLSAKLPEQVPLNIAMLAPLPEADPEAAAAAEQSGDPLDYLAANFGVVDWHEPDDSPHRLYTTPSSVSYARVYTQASPDSPWVARYAGCLDGKTWVPGTSYLGRVVQAEVGDNLLLLKRMGHPNEPQVPLREQTLVVYGDGHQIPARSTPEGIRTMPIPQATVIAHVVPSGHAANGNLAEVAQLGTYYAKHAVLSAEGSPGQAAVSPGVPDIDMESPQTGVLMSGAYLPDHIDDLRFEAPRPNGIVNPYDPHQLFSVSHAAYVAGDHPDLAILMVKPGHAATLSAMIQELERVGLHYGNIVVASGRARPDAPSAPVYDLADNPVMQPGDEFRI
jgi:hypothetical protein